METAIERTAQSRNRLPPVPIPASTAPILPKKQNHARLRDRAPPRFDCRTTGTSPVPYKNKQLLDAQGREYHIDTSVLRNNSAARKWHSLQPDPSFRLRAKQPHAIAMKNGSPFGIGGLWENWRDPTSGEWMRTFAIITTDANELVAEIHDRMPLILAPADYTRWLSDEPDPGDLMRPFPAEPMRMWPISTRVNKPENDDPSIVEPIAIATSAA